MLRKKSISLGFVLLTTLGALLLWAQPWFVFDVVLPSTSQTAISVDGSVAAASLSGLCLAMIALTAVLSLSRGLLAIILASFGGILSVASVVTGVTAALNPLGSSLSIFTKLTGLTSALQVQAYVSAVSLTPVVYLVIIVSVINLVAWMIVCVTARSWRPGRVGKYENSYVTTGNPAEGLVGGDSITHWDQLSTGIDPTTR